MAIRLSNFGWSLPTPRLGRKKKLRGRTELTPSSTDGQWLFLVPLKGGRWHIIPQLAVYTQYATYHLLGETETTIEMEVAGDQVDVFFAS